MKSRFTGTPQPDSSISQLSATGNGISGQFKSMGTAVSSAYSKTKNAVTAPFSKKEGEGTQVGDETSLASMPTVGPEIWVTGGQVYESQGNYAKALDNYTKALELDPSSEAALLSTARLYQRQQKNAEAADFFSKAIAVKPTPSTYNELALSYQNVGRTADAQMAIEKAIELDPSNVRYRNNYASMLVTTGRSGEAVGNLQQIFSPAVANYNVAYLHFKNNNVSAAQQHLQTALSLNPNLEEAKVLMNQISSNPAMQSAMAAYNTAQGVYRTAEAMRAPGTPTQATSSSYGGTAPNSTAYPSYPQQ